MKLFGRSRENRPPSGPNEYTFMPPIGRRERRGVRTLLAGDDGVRVVSEGVTKKHILYIEIRLVRLMHAPAAKGSWNIYYCVLEGRSKKELEFWSHSYGTFGLFPNDRGTEYSVFVKELHTKLARANPNVFYEAGMKKRSWRLTTWALLAVAGASTVAAALVSRSAFLFVVFWGTVVGLGPGISLWKNRPATYLPTEIPFRVLSKQAKKLDEQNVPRRS